MQFDTNDIPQADLIWEVARVPEAIAQGLNTPPAIAAYLGNKVPRQGLYYLQAAHILGLVTRDDDGEMKLTTYGRAFINYDHSSKQRGLRRLALEREPTHSLVIGLRASGGMGRDGLARQIKELSNLADSTARRRAQTVARWLCDLDLVQQQDGKLIYQAPVPATIASHQRQAA